MADVYNMKSGEFRRSIHSPDYVGEDWVFNPEIPPGVDVRECKWLAGKLVPMTPKEIKKRLQNQRQTIRARFCRWAKDLLTSPV